jgi:uncharacterized protein
MTNTEIVKGMYEAFGRGDIPALLNSLSEDADWTCPGPAVIPTAGRFKGRQEIAKFFETVAATTDFDPLVIDKFVEQGDTVVAIGSYSGRTKPMNKAFRSKWVMIFTLSGGKVIRFDEHFDTAALAEAYTGSAQGAKG